MSSAASNFTTRRAMLLVVLMVLMVKPDTPIRVLMNGGAAPVEPLRQPRTAWPLFDGCVPGLDATFMPTSQRLDLLGG